MTGDRLFNLLGAIVTVGLVTTIVGHPYTARVITAAGDAITGLMLAAMGEAGGQPRRRRR